MSTSPAILKSIWSPTACITVATILLVSLPLLCLPSEQEWSFLFFFLRSSYTATSNLQWNAIILKTKSKLFSATPECLYNWKVSLNTISPSICFVHFLLITISLFLSFNSWRPFHSKGICSRCSREPFSSARSYNSNFVSAEAFPDLSKYQLQ